MFAYPMTDNITVLIANENTTDVSYLIGLLIKYSYFEPLYESVSDVLVDLIVPYLIDKRITDKNQIDINNFNEYVFNRYFEGVYDLLNKKELEDFKKHLCVNLSEYKDNSIDYCSKVNLNMKIIKHEGLYDIRDILVYGGAEVNKNAKR